MIRIKRRIFSGVVCEQEVYMVKSGTNVKTAKPPKPRFATDEERAKHRSEISRKRFIRLVNENFGPSSFYCTLTFDNANEVHTFEDARRLRDNYVRCLQRAFPDLRLVIVMGRGKNTARIHFHAIIAGADKETIEKKWKYGSVVKCKNLRKNNRYKGVDCGQDYTGLANYLFDHWTQEQGGHRWKGTRNLRQPVMETPKEAKRCYTPNRPPLTPKGYKLVGIQTTGWGFYSFKYVLDIDLHKKR